jgi:hypothetical protein
LGGAVTLDFYSYEANANITPSNIASLNFMMFSPEAIIDIRHCNSAMQSSDWGVFANSLYESSGLRTVGYTRGLSFRGSDMQYRGGEGAEPPSSGPIYLVPNPNSTEVRYGF